MKIIVRSKTVQVILGKTSKNSEGISVESKNIRVHPDFQENVELHDLAIVEIPVVPISRENEIINITEQKK